MAFSFKKFWKGINIVPKTSSDNSSQGDVEVLSTDTKVHYHNGTTNSPIVTETHASQGANRLQSKDLDAGSTAIVDPSDTTKKVEFSASGATTGTATTIAATQTGNRTITLPDVTDTLAGVTASQTLTNKILTSPTINTPTLNGSGGALTLPAGPDTLIGRATTDTLSNKTLTSPTINNGTLNSSTINTPTLVGSGGTLTLPAGPDTLAGIATSQSLTNKTFGDAPIFTEISTPSSPSSGLLKLYPKTDGNFYTLNNSGIETQIGSGGSGTGKNYLTAYTASTSSGTQNAGNGNFELGSTTGWSLFNTTLTGVLPTGSITAGATSFTTFQATNTTPIGGKYSLDTAASGLFSAGQGFISNAFYIDTEDQAKVLTFKFYYSVLNGANNLNFSGTSSNTFAVYIYDVTNSAWIQPAGVYNLTQGTGVGYCSGTFQTTSSSTQYRLAVLCINSAGGGATVYWDDFTVGPQTAPYGSPVTDWQSYTPTVAQLGTGSGTVVGQYRRVGDSVEVSILFAKDGNAGTSTGSAVQFSLPSGLATDTSKLPSTSSRTSVGTGLKAAASNAAYDVSVLPSSYTNKLILTGNFSAVDAIGSDFGANTVWSFVAKVPISGWSSTVQMSNDTDTRVVAMSTQASGGTLTTTLQTSNFTWSAPSLDTHNAFSSGVYTVPVAGVYKISGMAGGGASGSYAIELAVFLNGSANGPTFIGAANSADSTVGYFDFQIKCKAGDTLALGGKVNTGTQAASPNSILNIQRLSGPATIAATETVAAAFNTSSQSFTTGVAATLNCTTKEYDTHGAYSGGTFTCPVSGKYRVSFGCTWAANSAGQRSANVVQTGSVSKSWVLDVRFPLGNSVAIQNNGSKTINCLAGDILAIQTLQTSGGNLALDGVAGDNWICFERIGN